MNKHDIPSMSALLIKHRKDVISQCLLGGTTTKVALMRKHAKDIDDAILAEARERALAELRAYKGN